MEAEHKSDTDIVADVTHIGVKCRCTCAIYLLRTSGDRGQQLKAGENMMVADVTQVET
jgi:predicted aconitase